LGLAAVLAGWLLQSHTPIADAAPPAQFALQEAASTAKVSVRKGGQETPCPLDPGSRRWQCSKDSYAFVGPYAGIAAGEALTGWWVHPMPGATTVARFTAPCSGVLRATLGLVDDAPAGAQLNVQIRAADKSLGSLGVSTPLQNGTLEAVLDHGKTCTIELEISAADHAWRMGVLALSIDPVEGGKR